MSKKLLNSGLALTLLASMTTMGFVGCAEDPFRDEDDLIGGVLATFVVGSESFRVWVSNPTTRADLVDLFTEGGPAGIPNGRLVMDSGLGQHNAPYSWHLDPVDIALVASSPDTCNGLPSEVELNLEAWLNEIGWYCPRDAQLINLESR